MVDDERFFAWLDGELEPAEAAWVAELVAASPELHAKAAAHRALHERLRSAFDPIADPSRADVVELASRRRAPARPISRPVQWMAMAATLAIGLFAGSMINSGNPGPVGRENGQLVASGELEQALYARLASAPADDGVRIGLTFRDAKGDLCRSFTEDGTSGLACHRSGDWRIRGLFQDGEGQSGDFRMAAGPDPRLGELIDATIAGEPLDAAGERRALDELR
jgi:hypothetical protein